MVTNSLSTYLVITTFLGDRMASFARLQGSKLDVFSQYLVNANGMSYLVVRTFISC